jgi:hypothetical protein
VASARVQRILMVVDFPAPLGPRKPKVAIAGVDRPGPAAGDAGFEYGLGLLIDGARARHAALLSAAPGHPVPAG